MKGFINFMKDNMSIDGKKVRTDFVSHVLKKSYDGVIGGAGAGGVFFMMNSVHDKKTITVEEHERIVGEMNRKYDLDKRKEYEEEKSEDKEEKTLPKDPKELLEYTPPSSATEEEVLNYEQAVEKMIKKKLDDVIAKRKDYDNALARLREIESKIAAHKVPSTCRRVLTHFFDAPVINKFRECDQCKAMVIEMNDLKNQMEDLRQSYNEYNVYVIKLKSAAEVHLKHMRQNRSKIVKSSLV